MKIRLFYTNTRSVKWVEIIDKVLLWSIVIFYGFLDVFRYEDYLMNTLGIRGFMKAVLFLLPVFALMHIEQLVTYYVDKKICNTRNKNLN